MKASITIHIETLWANRAEVNVEADLSDGPSRADHEVVSAMFEKARLLAADIEAVEDHGRSLPLTERYEPGPPSS